MIQWIRRQREDNTLIYRLAMNDHVYLGIGVVVVVTGFVSGLYR